VQRRRLTCYGLVEVFLYGVIRVGAETIIYVAAGGKVL
jgi:hypothetical protein